jgi:hypothetical protein
MKHYQASLYPLTFFLHLMQVIITGYFNELDLSYADSNEFLSRSLQHYTAETFLARHYIQKY